MHEGGGRSGARHPAGPDAGVAPPLAMRDAEAPIEDSRRVASRIALTFALAGLVLLVGADVVTHEVTEDLARARMVLVGEGLVLMVAAGIWLKWIVGKHLSRIRSSEERYRALAEAAPDSVFIVDAEGRVLYVNGHAANLMRATPGELIGMEQAVLFPGEEGARNKANFDAVFSSGEALRVEDRMTFPTGESWQETWLVPIRAADGSVEAVLGHGRDITDRKCAELSLMEEEERLRQIVLQMPYPAIVCAPDGTAVLVNEALMGLMGVGSADLLVGKLNVLDSVVPRKLGISDKMAKAFGGEVVHLSELEVDLGEIPARHESTAVGTRFVEAVFFPVKSPEGTVEHVVGVLHDVTDRRRAEAAVRESEERYRTIADAAGDVMFIIGRDDRIRYVNGHAAQRFGLMPKDMVGRKRAEFFPPEAAQEQRRHLDLVIETGEPLKVERLMPYGTRENWEETLLAPVRDESGNVEAVIGVSRDITERKRSEEMKNDFVSMVSHELRTPLSSIVGYANLIERLSPTADAAVFSDVLEKLQRRAQDMTELVDELLETNRIQAGDLALVLEEVDVVRLVKDCVDSAFLSDEHAITLDPGVERKAICGDRAKLAWAVRNLLANAVKFSPDGGAVDVRVAEAGASVRIEVTDQGIGIAPEEQDRVFGRFAQVDMSSTRAFGGFGMGLFITRAIVEAHGGHVGVSSAPGEGSTFTIEVPVDGPVATDGALASADPAPDAR